MKQIVFLLWVVSLNLILFANSEREIGERPVLDKAKVAKLIVYYTNIERVKKGLNLLEHNTVLTSASEIHSKYMFDTLNMSHYEAKLQNPEDRVSEACKSIGEKCMEQFEPSAEKKMGYHVICCGENVIASFANNTAGVSFRIKKDEKGQYRVWNKDVNWYNEESLAKDLVERWMNSPGHRRNILDPEYGAMGAAISDYADKTEYYYGTQVFSPILTGGIQTQAMKFDPIEKIGDNFQTTLDGGDVLEKYSLVLTKLSGDGKFSSSKKGKLYPLQISNLKSETIILIEIQDIYSPNIRYPYWKFKFIPSESLPKIDWVNW